MLSILKTAFLIYRNNVRTGRDLSLQGNPVHQLNP